MQLSLIIPSKTHDDPLLRRLLNTLKAQTFTDYEILVETEGNSEEAKGKAALEANGDILGFFCADNDLRDPNFLKIMVAYAKDPQVDGAYPARYDYVPRDTALSRYFALLGANDPVCWWLGKADRDDYTHPRCPSRITRFSTPLPSLGDNGFFIKRAVYLQAGFTPQTFGSCMCVCQDLVRIRGSLKLWVVDEQTLWHRTGERWFDYFKRRWVYVRTLYWQRHAMRRWLMVHSLRDGLSVLAFAVSSFLVFPHLWTSLRGYRRISDWAWFLHPLCCLGLTALYGVAWLEALMRPLSSPHSTVANQPRIM